MTKEAIVESSGNVFADLGFSPEEAALLAMRAVRMRTLHTKAWYYGSLRTKTDSSGTPTPVWKGVWRWLEHESGYCQASS